MDYSIKRDDAAQLADVLKAFSERKVIQRRRIGAKSWEDYVEGTLISHITLIPYVYEYRIKPVGRPFKTVEEVLLYIGKIISRRCVHDNVHIISGTEYLCDTLWILFGTFRIPSEICFEEYTFRDTGNPVGYLGDEPS